MSSLMRFANFVLGDLSTTQLPERVAVAIRRQQDRSELLIGGFQLFVVCTLGSIYLASPKTFTDEAAFAPVPYVLAIYLGLTVIRLLWSIYGHLPDWTLFVSAVTDITLLMVLIWSFHIQYEQPASFYLKAPTLLYVFIFIALRALRFEARYVLWTGFMAAAGWSCMILYVVYADPGDNMVTRNYVSYMTSNSILIGAEVDKIISIVTVTAIIAVALARAKSILIRAVSEQAAARELSRFFDPEVASKITLSHTGVRAGEGEIRQAAIVYLDMRGFTSLAQTLPPGEVMQILGEYQHRMVEAVQMHGGVIDKFMGDGIMATFGAAVPSDSYAADALAAIDEVLLQAKNWQEECQARGRPVLEVNASVASGPIIFGAVGDDTRLEYTVIGDAVNLAAKLEKQNKVEASLALAASDTYEAALAQGYQPNPGQQRRPQRQVAGVPEPMDLVVLG